MSKNKRGIIRSIIKKGAFKKDEKLPLDCVSKILKLLCFDLRKAREDKLFEVDDVSSLFEDLHCIKNSKINKESTIVRFENLLEKKNQINESIATYNENIVKIFSDLTGTKNPNSSSSTSSKTQSTSSVEMTLYEYRDSLQTWSNLFKKKSNAENRAIKESIHIGKLKEQIMGDITTNSKTTENEKSSNHRDKNKRDKEKDVLSGDEDDNNDDEFMSDEERREEEKSLTSKKRINRDVVDVDDKDEEENIMHQFSKRKRDNDDEDDVTIFETANSSDSDVNRDDKALDNTEQEDIMYYENVEDDSNKYKLGNAIVFDSDSDEEDEEGEDHQIASDQDEEENEDFNIFEANTQEH